MRINTLSASLLSVLCVTLTVASCAEGPDPDLGSPVWGPASSTPDPGPASEPAEHIGEAPEANVYVGGPYDAEDFPFKVVKSGMEGTKPAAGNRLTRSSSSSFATPRPKW